MTLNDQTTQVRTEITDASGEMHKVIVEVVETPTMPPALYAIVEYHSPDEGVVILRKIFLGAAGPL